MQYLPRFEPLYGEHFLACLHFDRNQVWRKFVCDMPHITAIMRDQLNEVGITESPLVKEEWPGRWLSMPLPRRICICTPVPMFGGFTFHHDQECEQLYCAHRHCWDSLEAATYGVDAPFRNPSPWYTAHEAQEALELLGMSPEAAMSALHLSLDVVWIEYFRRHTQHDPWHYRQDINLYREHPDWLAKEIEISRRYREQHNHPLPKEITDILYSVTLP